MIIDIDGDKILFGGIEVGELKGAWPTLREEFIKTVTGATDRDIDEECAVSWDEGYKEGFKAGRECG